MTSRTVFPGIPILASKGFLGKLDREDKVRERPAAPRPCRVFTGQLEFSSAPSPSAEPSMGAMYGRMWLIAPRSSAGTSRALESTFPVVKGHIVDQQPSGKPVPSSCDSRGSCVFLSLQPEGGFYSEPIGQIGSPVSD